MIRVIDALGFRYYWATEGIKEQEYDFRPSPDSRNMKEIIQRIQHLIYNIDINLGGMKDEIKEEVIPLIEQGFIFDSFTPDGYNLYKKRRARLLSF